MGGQEFAFKVLEGARAADLYRGPAHAIPRKEPLKEPADVGADAEGSEGGLERIGTVRAVATLQRVLTAKETARLRRREAAASKAFKSRRSLRLPDAPAGGGGGSAGGTGGFSVKAASAAGSPAASADATTPTPTTPTPPPAGTTAAKPAAADVAWQGLALELLRGRPRSLRGLEAALAAELAAAAGAGPPVLPPARKDLDALVRRAATFRAPGLFHLKPAANPALGSLLARFPPPPSMPTAAAAVAATAAATTKKTTTTDDLDASTAAQTAAGGGLRGEASAERRSVGGAGPVERRRHVEPVRPGRAPAAGREARLQALALAHVRRQNGRGGDFPPPPPAGALRERRGAGHKRPAAATAPASSAGSPDANLSPGDSDHLSGRWATAPFEDFAPSAKRAKKGRAAADGAAGHAWSGLADADLADGADDSQRSAGTAADGTRRAGGALRTEAEARAALAEYEDKYSEYFKVHRQLGRQLRDRLALGQAVADAPSGPDRQALAAQLRQLHAAGAAQTQRLDALQRRLHLELDRAKAELGAFSARQLGLALATEPANAASPPGL